MSILTYTSTRAMFSENNFPYNSQLKLKIEDRMNSYCLLKVKFLGGSVAVLQLFVTWVTFSKL
jgi:hypothetical protein